MPKKPRKAREVFNFTIAEVFPPDDPVAMDILCLMAAHNDLAFVGDWIRAHLQIPTARAAKSVAASRLFFLQRLFAAMMAEVLKTLEHLEDLAGFEAVRQRLDDDGQQALTTLHTVPVDPKGAIYRVLHMTRNKVAFHFDPGQFRASLKKMLERYGTDAESDFVVEADAPGYSRIYYGLAAQLTADISFGLPDPGALPLVQEAFQTALDLRGALAQFIQSAQAAYLASRGLRRVFRRAPIEA